MPGDHGFLRLENVHELSQMGDQAYTHPQGAQDGRAVRAGVVSQEAPAGAGNRPPRARNGQPDEDGEDGEGADVGSASE